MESFNSSWIKDITDTSQLHRFDYDSDDYHLISRVVAADHGDYETMIFLADEEGEVTDWGGVYLHRGYESIENSILNFLKEES